MSDSFVTPSAVAHQAPVSMRFPRQEYWSGLHLLLLLQGIFLTQRLNLHLLRLLRWQVDYPRHRTNTGSNLRRHKWGHGEGARETGEKVIKGTRVSRWPLWASLAGTFVETVWGMLRIIPPEAGTLGCLTTVFHPSLAEDCISSLTLQVCRDGSWGTSKSLQMEKKKDSDAWGGKPPITAVGKHQWAKGIWCRHRQHLHSQWK